ncbi:uncharacterized protein LOC110604589 isoform X2 [Manihot esculenta]|uniref:Uncharacterized protein n=1 Tax=Manihot esculenta TaxID=3983 RepID=A0ACB7G3P1_MANES|nr:uncharacterized protein LOC110604589 isoform X2 [Manihot esculenta]KAG8634710.1 hypothetical protein MANES_17G074250v8 [Manihot esculenta]
MCLLQRTALNKGREREREREEDVCLWFPLLLLLHSRDPNSLERDSMEYERIDKVQSGIISPSKLRMKLMGPHHNRKKDGSNSNSSRTSPSRLDDAEFVNNSLLASNDEEGDPAVDLSQVDQPSCQPKETLLKENGNVGRVKMQQFSKGESGNSTAVHPMRSFEDDNLDYDSNASSSSFEFHKERSVLNQFTRSLSRPMPSKWNDAEKWIMNKQNLQPNSKKNALHSQANRMLGTKTVRVAPESTNHDLKLVDTKRIDFCQPAPQMAFEKFSFIPPGTPSVSGQVYGGNSLIDQCTQSEDLQEVEQREIYDTKSLAEGTTVLPIIRSVCMRDMGTEMTPVTSQEPSRTATPVGAITPLRSPTSSIPSTPWREAPALTTMEHGTDDDTQHTSGKSRKELNEQEMKLRTRREIVALGVQLGKISIAAWASNHEKNTSEVETTDVEELERIEFEKRAAAWEEAEKSKHTARYKREEIKIQAWESQQKAKLEAEMRKIETQVEKMRAEAQAKMVKKISMARQRSEEKRAAAEARRNRDAEKAAAQAEYIRRTGRMPSSHYMCCGWLS